jgi:hypothetical protein
MLKIVQTLIQVTIIKMPDCCLDRYFPKKLSNLPNTWVSCWVKSQSLVQSLFKVLNCRVDLTFLNEVFLNFNELSEGPVKIFVVDWHLLRGFLRSV